MDKDKCTLFSLRQGIINNNLSVKAIIQDIIAFRGSLSELEKLNEAGRSKLSALRTDIGKLDDWAKDEGDPEIAIEAESHLQQLSRTFQAFRKANIATMLEIEKMDKEELFTNPETKLRHRNSTKRTRSSQISQLDSVTDKMLAISRHLSETTQKSAVTLETLVASSANIEGTSDELQTTARTISQSGKLLQKYGRRECTDKILLFFGFVFFIVCVLYIVQRRLF